MCLYIDEYVGTPLSDGTHVARKGHRCDECFRTIDVGETYWFWTVLDQDEGKPVTWKMCTHCNATIDVGCAITGCPKSWYWTMVHDLDDESGFVGDILHHDHLTQAQRHLMLRAVAGRRRHWRRKDGSLLPLPTLPGPQAPA